MKHLKDVPINGNPEHVRVVLDNFGMVEFNRTGFDAEDVEFTVTAVLPNFYRHGDAKNKKALLYVLVPNMDIHMVWPGNNFEDIRLGIATRKPHAVLCPAIAMHKGVIGLYLCLNPNGIHIKEIGALGI